MLLLLRTLRETRYQLKDVNRHAAAVGMRSSASITKVMSALIPGEQRQTALLNGAPLEDADKFKYLGPTFVAKDQDTEETRSRINLTCSAFSHLQSCFFCRGVEYH